MFMGFAALRLVTEFPNWLKITGFGFIGFAALALFFVNGLAKCLRASLRYALLPNFETHHNSSSVFSRQPVNLSTCQLFFRISRQLVNPSTCIPFITSNDAFNSVFAFPTHFTGSPQSIFKAPDSFSCFFNSGSDLRNSFYKSPGAGCELPNSFSELPNASFAFHNLFSGLTRAGCQLPYYFLGLSNASFAFPDSFSGLARSRYELPNSFSVVTSSGNCHHNSFYYFT
jgi:hypothetical protein